MKNYPVGNELTGYLVIIRHGILQIFGRFQIFSIQNTVSKVVGFHLKVTKILFLKGDEGVFRLLAGGFRFFHEELSLMPG